MERKRPVAGPTGPGPAGPGPAGGADPSGAVPADPGAPRGRIRPTPAAGMTAGGLLARPGITEALTRALFEEWARTGYASLSLEAVARRAGIGRTALYRRWPSKSAMAVDRIGSLGIDLILAPDTGTLRGDLRAVLQVLRRLLRHPLVRRILPDLHAELLRNPDLAAGLAERLKAAGRVRSQALVRRAVARGELSGTIDIDLATDALAGIIYWRLIVAGGRADMAYLDALAGFLSAAMQGLAPPDRRPRRRLK